MISNKKRIDDFCYVTDFVANGSFKSLKENVKYLNKKDYAILVRLTDYTNNWRSDFKYVNKKTYEFLKKSSLNKGDLVMSNVGEPGIVFIVPDLDMPMTLGPNTILIRPNEKISSSKYLYYFFKSRDGIDKINKITSVTTLRKFNKTSFRKLEIKLPSLEIQKKITNSCQILDDIILKRKKKLIQINFLQNSLFSRFFGNPLSNDKKWQTYKLSEVAVFENGDRSKNYPSGDDVVNKGVLFLSTKNILNNELDLNISKYISEKKFKSLSRGKAKHSDLIITLRGTLGACIIFNKDKAFINAQMMIIRPNELINNHYLHSLLTSPLMSRHLKEISSGAAVPQLTAKQLGNLIIPCPPIDMQMKFKQMLEKIAKIKNIFLQSQNSEKELLLSLEKSFFH